MLSHSFANSTDVIFEELGDLLANPLMSLLVDKFQTLFLKIIISVMYICIYVYFFFYFMVSFEVAQTKVFS